MKNYYEILEVSQNASSEVIEKAHKALIKKYHPDLQPQEKKQDAENKVKEINEAYEVLSDINKKAKYDEELNKQKIREEQKKYAETKNNNTNNINTNTSVNNNYSDPGIQKQVIRKPQTVQKENNSVNYDLQDELNKAVNEAYNNAYSNAYNQAYYNTLKNMGYNVRYKKTFKERVKTFFAFIFAFVVLIVIGFILWHIPPIKRYLLELYATNDIIRFSFDIIYNIITSFIHLFEKK